MSQFARGGSQPSDGEELDYFLRRLETELQYLGLN